MADNRDLNHARAHSDEQRNAARIGSKGWGKRGGQRRERCTSRGHRRSKSSRPLFPRKFYSRGCSSSRSPATAVCSAFLAIFHAANAHRYRSNFCGAAVAADTFAAVVPRIYNLRGKLYVARSCRRRKLDTVKPRRTQCARSAPEKFGTVLHEIHISGRVLYYNFPGHAVIKGINPAGNWNVSILLWQLLHLDEHSIVEPLDLDSFLLEMVNTFWWDVGESFLN